MLEHAESAFSPSSTSRSGNSQSEPSHSISNTRLASAEIFEKEHHARTVFGLPVHPLVVHATVVMVPLAALLLILSSVSARFRRWAGLLTPGVVAAIVAGAQVARIGHSGAEAAWSDVVTAGNNQTPSPAGGESD